MQAQAVSLVETYNPRRYLPSGELAGIYDMFMTAALVVGITDRGASYKCRYCYEHRQDAESALMEWNGEGDPPGPWIKRKGGGPDKLGPGAIRWRKL